MHFKIFLMARLIRFRVTAFPIFLETLMPKRKCSYSLFNVYTTNCLLATDFPFYKFLELTIPFYTISFLHA